jgi:peptide/nickel transport system substrate-binding protein
MKSAVLRFLMCFCVVGMAGLVACSKPAVQPAPPLRIALRSVVNSLDPISENTVHGGSVYLNLYDTLVQRDHSLTIRPSLAVRWATPDDLTWIFELRKDAHFSDGSAVTAADVKFSLDRLMNTAGVQQAAALAMLDRIEILSDFSIKLITRYPSSSLTVRLADISILPRGKVSTASIIPGGGPYKVKSWSPGKFVQMEVNPYYWGMKPVFPEVRYIAFENTHDSVEALIKNELDVLPQIDPDTIQEFDLLNRKDEVVISEPGLLVLYLAFRMAPNGSAAGNLKKNPFEDLRVRQAVYHAINAERMIREVQKGYADPATQLVSPIVYGFNNRLQRLPFDPKKSRKLLSQAGYPDGFDIRLDATNNRYRRDVQTAKAVAADLAAVGIRVQLNAKPLKEWLELRRKGESSFYLGGWVVGSGDASGALDYLLHTPDSNAGYGSANDGHYSNPALDALIEECGSTMEPRARLELLEEAMQVAMNDVAVVPLYVEKNLTVTRKNILWESYPDQIIRLNFIRRR